MRTSPGPSPRPARARVRRFAALVACVVSWPALTAAGGAAVAHAEIDGRLTLERNATVDAPVVRVGDVAALEGNARALADVDLGPAPEPGSTRRLSGASILRRLTEAGLESATMRYRIPATVVVTRAFQEIGVAELDRAAEQEIAARLAPGERLRDVAAAAAVRIPPGPYETRLAPIGAARGAVRRFDLTLVQADATVGSVPVHATVEAFGPVVTARRAIARGTVLAAEDLAVEQRDLGAVPGGVVRSPAEAIGKQTDVALTPGAALMVQALASPLLVRRGDVVTVVVETPGMRLSLPADALEAGAAGTRVRAVNRRSKQEIEGQVVDRGTILVQY